MLPPLSLYIHTPWCVKKCPYCDFNSHEHQGELPEKEFLAALLDDLAGELSLVQGRELVSIFIGGGTPSLLSADFYGRLLTELSTKIRFSPDIEITLEANPGTFEQEKFAGFREVGINRLSIGVQSFSGQHLSKLGRIHDGDEAYRAVKLAQSVGFDNINIDLMFGLSEQSQQAAMDDLQQAIELKPRHISWYQLTIEQNTYFYKNRPILPNDDFIWDMQVAGKKLLEEAGFRNYEISAYGQEGFRSRHNLNYWQFGDYLALGPGAHGKITTPDPTTAKRYWKTRAPGDYLNPDKAYCAGENILKKSDLGFEFMLNALRLVDGSSREIFTSRTGEPWSAVEGKVATLVTEGLMWDDGNHFGPTAKGQQYLNFLLERFLD
ncbi:MAG: radical SAM family heme chaperone HemW [Pseudomonadales bacterium]|nr:radical SAM family heme chaperone HemW [Pseudomonadales bacterium]